MEMNADGKILSRYERTWEAFRARTGAFRAGDLTVPGVTLALVINDLNYLVFKGVLKKLRRGVFIKAEDYGAHAARALGEPPPKGASALPATPNEGDAPVMSEVEKRFREFRAGLNIRPQRTWEEAQRDRGTKRERGCSCRTGTLGNPAPIVGAPAPEAEEEEAEES